MQYPISWGIEFPNNISILGGLSHSLVGALDAFLMTEEDDDFPNYYTFGSAHIEAAKDLEAARKIAGSICCLFNGAFQIEFGEEYSPPKFGRMYGSAHRSVEIIHPDALLYPPFASDIIQSAPTTREEHALNSSFIARALFSARTSARVYGILSFIGANGITWVSLYGVHEFIRSAKDDGWDVARVQEEANWTNTQYKSFTGTANSSHYLGPFARHGHLAGEPIKRPMKRSEAVKGILTASKAYIEERYKGSIKRTE